MRLASMTVVAGLLPTAGALIVGSAPNCGSAVSRVADPVCIFSFLEKEAPAEPKKAGIFSRGKVVPTKKVVAKKAFKKNPKNLQVNPIIGAAFLGSPLAFAAALVVGVVLFRPDGLPDQTPFGFLDGFYPPAIERKAQQQAKAEKIAAAAKAEKDKLAKEAEAKKAKEAEEAKKAAESAAAAEAAAKKAAPVAKAAPPKPPPAAPKPKPAPVAAKAKPAPAPAAAPAAPAAKAPATKAAPVTKIKYDRKYDDARIGKAAALPMVNKDLANKPGFNAQGEPGTPGIAISYQKEQAKKAAEATKASEIAAAKDAALKQAKEQQALNAAANAKREAAITAKKEAAYARLQQQVDARKSAAAAKAAEQAARVAK